MYYADKKFNLEIRTFFTDSLRNNMECNGGSKSTLSIKIVI